MFQPPTDSLYKFMAISGLILMIASVYLTGLLLVRSQEAIHKSRIDYAGYSADTEYYNKRIDMVKKIIESGQKQGVYTSKDLPLNLKYSDDELKKLLKENLILSRDMKANEELNDLSNQWINSRVRSLDRYSITGMFFLIVGMSISLYGFWAWYYKIQIHQNKIIANSAKKSDMEMGK